MSFLVIMLSEPPRRLIWSSIAPTSKHNTACSSLAYTTCVGTHKYNEHRAERSCRYKRINPPWYSHNGDRTAKEEAEKYNHTEPQKLVVDEIQTKGPRGRKDRRQYCG